MWDPPLVQNLTTQLLLRMFIFTTDSWGSWPNPHNSATLVNMRNPWGHILEVSKRETGLPSEMKLDVTLAIVTTHMFGQPESETDFVHLAWTWKTRHELPIFLGLRTYKWTWMNIVYCQVSESWKEIECGFYPILNPTQQPISVGGSIFTQLSQIAKTTWGFSSSDLCPLGI